MVEAAGAATVVHSFFRSGSAFLAVRHSALFQAQHAEEFVRYLRTIQVSANG